MEIRGELHQRSPTIWPDLRSLQSVIQVTARRLQAAITFTEGKRDDTVEV